MAEPTCNYPLNWQLLDLMPHPETAEFRQRLASLKAQLTAVADALDALPPLTATDSVTRQWAEWLQQYEAIDRQLADVRSTVGCWNAVEAENVAFQQLEAELSALNPLRDRVKVSLEFQLRPLDPEELLAVCCQQPFLQENAFYLQLKRKMAGFRLPREQELLASDLAVDGLHAWGRLYDRMCGRLRITVMERGRPVTKSVGQVQFDSPDRSQRERNFFAADGAWETVAETAAEALNHIAGSRLTLYRRLGLRDHLEVPLAENRMSRQTLETMWSTIAAKKSSLVPYLERKARLLGLTQLCWWDLQAPLPAWPGQPADAEISYQQACETVTAAFGRFSGELAEFAEQAFTGRWVEAEDRHGKRQGAFCTGFPHAGVSRVFMTFTRSADSMSTLAHELGHAYHNWVLRDASSFLQDYPMNLAETASTFAEAVLAEERLAAAATPMGRLRILDEMLSDSVAYLMNIHARFVFEDQFHRERQNGEVPAQRLSELMVAAQRETYLGLLADDGWNPRFWVSKLHFYITELPFYNFPYTFGYLLSLGLYSLGRERPGVFAGQFRDFLVATGSQDAESAVQGACGYDLRQATFWESSLAIIERRAAEFVTLADELLGSSH